MAQKSFAFCGLVVGALVVVGACSTTQHDFGNSSTTGAMGGAGNTGTGGSGAAGPTCSDHQQNGTESDTDCGGKDCTGCGLGKGCKAKTDCESQLVCDGTNHCCAPKKCTDVECAIQDDGCGNTLDCGKTHYFCDANSDCKSGKCTCTGGGCTLLSESFTNAAIYGMAIDSQGNAIVGGSFTDKLSFDGLDDLSTLGPGSGDAFIAKFDPGGRPLWAKRIGEVNQNLGGQTVQAVAVDKSDNIFVTGVVGGGGAIIDFGLKPHVATYDIPTMFVLGLKPNGDSQWVQVTPDVTNYTSSAAIGCDKAGNVYVTGEYAGTPTVGGASLIDTGGQRALFVASYQGTNGKHRFSKGYSDGSSSSTGASLAIGAQRVYVAGAVTGSINFGAGGSYTNDGSENDVLVASFKMDTGDADWARFFGGQGSPDIATSVAVDANENVFIMGYYTASPTYVASQGALLDAGSQFNTFLLQVVGGGEAVRAQGYGPPPPNDGASTYGGVVAVAPSGSVMVSAYYEGDQVRIGSAPGTVLTNSGEAGSGSLFLAKLKKGEPTWAESFQGGGTSPLSTNAIAVDADGNTWVAGLFSTSVSLGSPVLLGGSNDAFLAKFGP